MRTGMLSRSPEDESGGVALTLLLLISGRLKRGDSEWRGLMVASLRLWQWYPLPCEEFQCSLNTGLLLCNVSFVCVMSVQHASTLSPRLPRHQVRCSLAGESDSETLADLCSCANYTR